MYANLHMHVFYEKLFPKTAVLKNIQLGMSCESFVVKLYLPELLRKRTQQAMKSSEVIT